MRRFCRIAAPVVAASFLIREPAAQAQLAVICPTCSNLITQALQLTREADSLKEQIQMYQNMLQNTKTLQSMSWNDASGNIVQIHALMNSAMTLDGQAQDFTSTLSNVQGFASRLQTLNQMTAQYQEWGSVTSSDITHMQASIGMQEMQRADDAATLATLQQHSEDAVGQMQALQAGNEMAALGVSQMQKLQEMLAQESQLVLDQTSVEAERRAGEDSALELFLQGNPPALAGNGPGFN